MTSAYGPADPAVARWIRALAQGLHWARSQPSAPETRTEWLRPAIALARLGLPDALLGRLRESDAFEEISGRVLVLHGQPRYLQFHWWAALEVARDSASEPASRREALAMRLHHLASELEMAHRVAAGLERFGTGAEPAAALVEVTRRAEAWLGLDEGLRHGPVPGLEVDYPVTYRLAAALGELRAAHGLQADGADHRLQRELGPALQTLGFAGSLPADFEGLESPGPRLWEALDAWLEVAVGGLADTVYRVAHDTSVLGLVPFRGLTFRRALGGLQQATRRLRAVALQRELDLLAEAVDAASDPSGPPPTDLARRVRRWLDQTVPVDGIDALAHGRVLAWAHRFQSFHGGVDGPRIERFLAQFPGELRWVGEGLLDGVEYRSRARIARSLVFVLQAYGLARAQGACIVSAGDMAWWSDLRDAGLRLPHRTLADALADPGLRTLIVCDDALLTGARQEEALAEALDGLDERARAALPDRDLVCVFSLATYVGIDHLGQWLEEQGLRPRILVGKEERLLSALGLEELEADTLYDEDSGALTQPSAQLAAPLFSPHESVWGDHDPAVARELCAEIGADLIRGLPETEGWAESRIQGSALGAGGLQGRHVFGHRVPPSTVTCLWCAGEWRGRPWVPLFPEGEP